MALCSLRCLFSTHCSSLFNSLVWMPTLTASLQLLRSAAVASQSAGLMLPVFISRLQTSLYLRTGLPTGRDPVVSSPCSMSLGILPSWRFCDRMANTLRIPACSKTSLFGTWSCQEMPKIRLRQRRWKVLSLRSWR